jgi:hypothetical protein
MYISQCIFDKWQIFDETQKWNECLGAGLPDGLFLDQKS